jgi:hypothetical protein
MTNRIEMPWDFTTTPEPGSGVPNEPTPEGRELGAHFARWADEAEAEQRKQFPDMLPRCNECAFRAGTRPNGCPGTLMDALKCLMELTPFYCHKGVKDGEEPTRLCTGYMVLLSGRADAQQPVAAEGETL